MMRSTPQLEFWTGVRDEAPILLGVIPFGMIYGVLAIGAGLPVGMAIAMSSIVFAGSSQFIGTQLFSSGAPGLVIVLTTAVVNLRHMLYSASAAPHFEHLPTHWKWLLAYLMTDEAYAVGITRYHREDPSPYKHWYFFGAGLTLWSSWQVSSAIGVLVGARIPAEWSLDFTLALTFIALVFPALRDRASVAAAVTAGVAALAASGLPLRLGLIVAAIAGILAGLIVEANTGPQPKVGADRQPETTGG